MLLWDNLSQNSFIDKKVRGRAKFDGKSVYISNSGPSGWHLSLVSVESRGFFFSYSSWDGMLVHLRVSPSIKFAGTH